MLEPKEADLPVLFSVLVVLPVVLYILLGKWSETSKKNERINLLAQLAAEEAFRAEAMATEEAFRAEAMAAEGAFRAKAVATASAVSLTSSMKNASHVCARCFSVATTRCSRCKSVRYCSGKCQILHWRQVHKGECVPVEPSSTNSSSKVVPVDDSILHENNLDLRFDGHNTKQAVMEKAVLDNFMQHSVSTAESSSRNCRSVDKPQNTTMETKNPERRYSSKSNKEASRRENIHLSDLPKESNGSEALSSAHADSNSSKDVFPRHKSRDNDHVKSEGIIKKHYFGNSDEWSKEQTGARGTARESLKHQAPYDKKPESRRESGCSSTQPPIKGNRSVKSFRSVAVVLGENSCPETNGKRCSADDSKAHRIRDDTPVQEGNGVTSMGIMKMMGLKKSAKPSRPGASEKFKDSHKKIKMLFPYEEFVNFFHCEVLDLSPRGLVNCGNSCYANAVLQCLTCTKPLVVYLLRRTHSRACSGKDWCLMCELEQHLFMLREIGGPLSASRILLHMRSVNYQIGDGSQEDAHEFLRLLVACMQSICLEGASGDGKVDPKSQETTFIQHTFGGSLRSKVKCLRCHHESERYENILDLSLEIYGWVESLEDALTQFTTPEDLDGENMYRCGRCGEYVRARKQLSIHEAPNILTIVLKRFREGRYGKINKCITFPDMLDMVPFMTGTGDIPPLYMLYGVVVHLDTLNASFSGHYVSYVKDLRGNWFRIDDSEVQSVPMSQVMSEGAYILFYMRSCPRPDRIHTSKSHPRRYLEPIRRCTPRDHRNPPLQERTRSTTTNNFVSTQFVSDLRPNRNIPPYGESFEFSDATSSDWSIFTSSDDASFTTESTRDSFSTVDYTDACNADPFSILNTLYTVEPSLRNSVACRMFSGSQPQTRFFSEEKGYVTDSYMPWQPEYGCAFGDPGPSFFSDYHRSMFVNYGMKPKYTLDRNSSRYH